MESVYELPATTLEFSCEYGPPDTPERNTSNPTFGMLGVQVKSTEWEPVCVPLPDREIVAGEFEALLATVTLPAKLPTAAGANVSSNVADCPGARIMPAETPLPEKTAPEPLTFETVTSEFPALVKVTLNTLLFPMATLPNPRLDVLVVSKLVAATPVPLKETVLGEPDASLSMETAADTVPGDFGEKMTLNVDCFPGPIVKGSEIPEIINPAAVTLAFVTWTLDAPPFDMVTD